MPQEEKNGERTRGPELQSMPEEGEENEKVRESESEKITEPLPANKSKLAPEKIASARTQMLLRLRRSIGLC